MDRSTRNVRSRRRDRLQYRNRSSCKSPPAPSSRARPVLERKVPINPRPMLIERQGRKLRQSTRRGCTRANSYHLHPPWHALGATPTNDRNVSGTYKTDSDPTEASLFQVMLSDPVTLSMRRPLDGFPNGR